MIKLNRTTEYSLMAISYIREKSAGELTSAREIADRFGLPFEILAKTLQKLKEQGIIASSYGTRGGYVLSRNLNTLNLADFLQMMEGPVSVVGCAHSAEAPGCEYSNACGIRPTMSDLNRRISDFLKQISIEELTRSSTITVHPIASAATITSTPVYGEEP